jgi:hypothetical protein
LSFQIGKIRRAGHCGTGDLNHFVWQALAAIAAAEKKKCLRNASAMRFAGMSCCEDKRPCGAVNFTHSNAITGTF